MLLKDGVLREKAAAALVLIGDSGDRAASFAFLYDPKASEVEAEGERVLSYASVRLTANGLLGCSSFSEAWVNASGQRPRWTFQSGRQPLRRSSAGEYRSLRL